MPKIYISLGTNLGDRVQNLERARELIMRDGFEIQQKSKIHETEEWTSIEQIGQRLVDSSQSQKTTTAMYLNQCICASVNFSPVVAFEKLRAIEKEIGRDRHAEKLFKKTHNVEFAPRIIDLDILLYDDWFVREGRALVNSDGTFEELIIPHPRMHLRKFVLGPLSEIAPDILHPVLRKKISELNRIS